MADLDLASLVVCDAGPLIHLDELNCLDLLSIYPDVYVPEMVWQEVSEHRPAALLNRHLSLRHVEFVPAA